MAKRALPQIGKVIEDRKARIAADLDDATRMQQKADRRGERGAWRAEPLADARAKAQSLAQAARDQAAADADAKRKALEDDLAAKLANAEKQIAATRAQAMTNVSAIAARRGGRIVERLGGKAGADPGNVVPLQGRAGRARTERKNQSGQRPCISTLKSSSPSVFSVSSRCCSMSARTRWWRRASMPAARRSRANSLRPPSCATRRPAPARASFEKEEGGSRSSSAANIIAEARSQAEQLPAKDAADRLADFVTRRTKQAGRAKIAFR